LGTYLVSLCKLFYEERSALNAVKPIVNPAATPSQAISQKTIHQCKHCLTIYDSKLGDEANDIAAGTDFRDLPHSYLCPLCEAGKEDFIEVQNTFELTS
jgi:rubredoxin